MAFAIRNYFNSEFKGNPALVDWVVHVYEGNGSSANLAQEVGVHKCNEDDWNKFHKPSTKSKLAYDDLKKKNQMFCMNEADVKGQPVNKKLFGESEYVANRFIEIMFKPCVPVARKFRNETGCVMKNPSDKKELARRLKKTKTWLGEPELMIIYNEAKLNMEFFDERRIMKRAEVLNF